MLVKTIIDEDFINYHKPSMIVLFPKCSWKCDKECGKQVCQNSTLATSPTIEVDIDNLIKRYTKNPITSALICSGLEPFDSCEDLLSLVYTFRLNRKDDIVIYTGYTEEELENQNSNSKIISTYEKLKEYKNIIVKFGRFIPNQESHYDEILGVKLKSSNQYAKIINKE